MHLKCKVYIYFSGFFSVVTELYNHYYNFRTFLSPEKETSWHLTIAPSSSHSRPPHLPTPSQPQATIIIVLSPDLPTLDISNEWNHTICNPFWLASFTQHRVFRGHLCCGIYQYFIPFYCQITFNCMDVPHFIYSFVS